MRFFMRVAMALFALTLVFIAFAYLSGGYSWRQTFGTHESPVGQTSSDSSVVSPGQSNRNSAAEEQSTSATTKAPSD